MLNIPRICPRFLITVSRLNCNTFRFGFATTEAAVSTLEEVPTTNIVTKTKPVKKGTKKIRAPKSQQLLEYISQNAGTFASTANELLPTKSIKVLSSIPTSVYLIDQAVASEIKEVIRSQSLDLDAPAIELNPGVGLLTSELTQLGFKNLTCFEEQPKLATFIREELKVPVIQKSFFDLPKLHHVDKVDGGSRIGNLLSQIKVQNPSEEEGIQKKNLHVFGAVPHLSFINFTTKSLVTQKVLYEDDWGWDEPIYYVALGPRAYWILTSTPTSGFFVYRPSAVTFQLLFKTTLFRTVSRTAFIPWVKHSSEDRSAKLKVQNDFDPDHMYFLKIETNHEVIEKLGRDNLLQFWYFVRQHLFSRKNAVIPELEQWIPGCGARLIRQGFTIYTQFGELSPEQILDIYLQFVSWPEFPGSSFLNAVEKFQSRIDRQDEDVMEFHKAP